MNYIILIISLTFGVLKSIIPKIHHFCYYFSIFIIGANKLNTFLSGVFDGIVFFPVINGGCIALNTLASKIFLKEKLSKMQITGIITSFIAIVLIALR